MTNERINNAVEKALEVLGKEARICMSSHSDWNSFGGRIGQYSHYWTNSNGTKMSETKADESLCKYTYDRKHFCSVSWCGGYSWDWSTSYEGGIKYHTDIADIIYNNVNSDSRVDIYAFPKLNKKRVEAIKTALNAIADITEEEIMEAIKQVDVFNFLNK